MDILVEPIAKSLNIKNEQVINTLKLLEEGNTVPFIARYRKEVTHGLDEEQIVFIQKEYAYQQNLKQRKEDVLRLIEKQGKLTDKIVEDINKCTKLSQVDDIYRPYQQKKKTRAAIALALGLGPLADKICSCPKFFDVNLECAKYINENVENVDKAIKLAQDIIAERISDDAKLRWKIMDSITKYGKIITKAKKDHSDDKKVYKMYYDHSEPVNKIANHRIMAIDRAEKEKVINVSFDYDIEYFKRYALRGITRDRDTACLSYIEEAVDDGLKRLLFPSVEREIRNNLSARAQERSIEIFSLNLEKLLLQPPIANKMILGFDPAFRTGCKLAVVDSTGKLVKIDVIYPHPPVNKVAEAQAKLVKLCKEYPIKIIAIGNGTASRESESFVAKTIKDNGLDVLYTLVSEAGASVYSASELARQEFPDLTVEKRSAISIARRLIDPLAELIKIDPKSIGVGQYQHDLPDKQLSERLDFAILKCVNRVGVDVNTASMELLMHVAGLNKANAKEIVEYRNEHGRFDNRNQLKKVKKMGDKTFEQCAGFLRIHDGSEPLDQTGIHPESYDLAKKLLSSYTLEDLSKIDIKQCAKELGSDEYTINDIVNILKEPGRDYREQFDGPILRSDILEISDLKVGDKLQGVVRNVTDFGAFIDIGLHEDGLAHISRLSQNRINHPSEVVSVNDIVDVYVADIDLEREKVQLSLVKV